MSALNLTSIETGISRENIVPVLNEIRHALKKLVDSNETTVIDIKSLPFGEQEEKKLLKILGEGEVQITLNSMGESVIYETHFQGVWVVTHKNYDAQIASRFIEICYVPEIVKTPPEDIEDSIRELVRTLKD
ncbi:MAG: hydrogenase accessory protein HupE [Gammaproteobacteria bacterium]|nr:hydrogenase accessory protein HupE [Gammaproteobacteria bacterium]